MAKQAQTLGISTKSSTPQRGKANELPSVIDYRKEINFRQTLTFEAETDAPPQAASAKTICLPSRCLCRCPCCGLFFVVVPECSTGQCICRFVFRARNTFSHCQQVHQPVTSQRATCRGPNAEGSRSFERSAPAASRPGGSAMQSTGRAARARAAGRERSAIDPMRLATLAHCSTLRHSSPLSFESC